MKSPDFISVPRWKPELGMGLILITIFLSFPPSPAVSVELQYDTTAVSVLDDTGIIYDTLIVRIADDPLKQYIGLRNAEKLASGRGMLFLYRQAAPRTFTMKDMMIPLDIVFVGSDGKIDSIHSVEPGVESIKSREPAQWVLEARKGWARRQGIKRGYKLAIGIDKRGSDGFRGLKSGDP